ncbi:hypothetical protein D3C71_1742290 [compost metagenome]
MGVIVAVVTAAVAQRAVAAPRQRQRQIHAVVVVAVIFVAIAGQRQADIPETLQVEIARQRQVVTVIRRPVPVGLVVVVEIGTQPQIAELLVKGDGVHLLAAVGACTVAARIQVFAHRHIVALREAVAGKGHLAVVVVKALGIAQAV